MLKAEGYAVASQPIPGVAGDHPEPLQRQGRADRCSQLYVRQALEDLINRPQIVSQGLRRLRRPRQRAGPGRRLQPVGLAAGEVRRPLPVRPVQGDRAAEGARLEGGAERHLHLPASRHRRGRLRGRHRRGRAAVLPARSTPPGSTSSDEQYAAIQSSEAQAGVKISLKSEPFNSLVSTVGVCNAGSHPASTCGWQLVDFGYDPYDLYPAGDGFFNTDGNDNQGGYSSAEMNSLINDTEYGCSTQTFFAYEDYTARAAAAGCGCRLPSNIQVYKSNLAGYAPLNPFTGGLNPEDWYFTK